MDEKFSPLCFVFGNSYEECEDGFVLNVNFNGSINISEL